MLKRLSSMTSMKRISSAFTEAEEQIDDGFAPYNVKEHDIQEITVPTCEKKNNALVFSIESKQGQRTWRNFITGEILELFSLSIMDKISPSGANLPFPALASQDGEDVVVEKVRDAVERWLNSLLALPLSSGEINQLYCILMERFAQVHQTDEYMKRIDSPMRISGQHLIKTGYVTKLDLKYFLSEEDFLKQREPKGVISLSSYFVTASEAPNAQHEFTVYTIPFPLTCRTDSEVEMSSWIETLRVAQGVL